MVQPKARLYQRFRTKGFPWVPVEFHKNESPRPRAAGHRTLSVRICQWITGSETCISI
jgi:hypothetical protein